MFGMSHFRKHVFIPMTDDVLDNPELLAELVPYQPGYLLAPGANMEDQSEPGIKVMRSPGDKPSSDALPAFSSKTYIAGPVLG